MVTIHSKKSKKNFKKKSPRKSKKKKLANLVPGYPGTEFTR